MQDYSSLSAQDKAKQLNEELMDLELKLRREDFASIGDYAIDRDSFLKMAAILREGGDTELNHVRLDFLLLLFAGDSQVAQAFEDAPKWYA